MVIRKNSNDVDILEFGVKGDGTTDDTQAILRAQEYAISINAPRLIFPEPSSFYNVTSTLTLDISKIKWVGKKARIKYTGTVDEPIIRLTSTGNSNPYTQKDMALEGFEIYGTGKTRNTGIHFEGTSANNSVSAIRVGANIHDVKYGMVFYSNAYLIECIVDTWNCAIGAYLKYGGSNYGENIKLMGAYYNSDLAFQNDIAGGEFYIKGASVDYNTKLAVANNGGKFFLDTTHVEYTSNTNTQIELNGEGAAFSMLGGTFVSGGATKPDYVAFCDAGNNGGIWFSQVYMGSLLTNTDFFANVVKGTAIIDKPILNNVPNMPRFVSTKSNKLIDGGFEKTSIVDEIFISSDTGTITNPLTGTNIALVTDTAQFRSGARSLKITKSVGSGLPSKACIAIPVSFAKKLNYRLYYKKPGSGTGNVAFVPAFAKIVYNDSGVATFKNLQYQGSGSTVTFTATAVDWTVMQTDATTVTAPAWASHYLIEISLDWFTADSIYIDDVTIGEM